MDLVHERASSGPPLVVDLLNRRGGDGEEANGSRPLNNSNGDSGQRSEDAPDAWPQAFRRRNSPTPSGAAAAGYSAAQHIIPTGPVAPMPVEKDSEVYNMNHRRRGVAYVFNHMHFDERLGLKQRNGTNADRDNLRLTLRSLDFEVRVYNDLVFKVGQRRPCNNPY